MAQISVIVPVYKTEAYLHRCVDSVLSQSFRDLELILVDDGSPDGSPAICDAYAEKDPRVRVIHQSNGGLSAARNAGLDWMQAHSESQWIFFLDSDDWIEKRTLETMLQAAEAHKTAVCACGYQRTEGEQPPVQEADLLPQLWNTAELYQKETVLLTVAWAKLYRRDCFATIRFPVGKLHEDEFTTYRVLFQQEKLTYVPAPFYAYYWNPQSITGSRWNPRRTDVWEAYRQQIRFFEDRGQRALAGVCLERYLMNLFGQLHEIQKQKDPQLEEKYCPWIDGEIKRLLPQARRWKCMDFEKDCGLLAQYDPLRTKLKMYGNALGNRLKGRKHA